MSIVKNPIKQEGKNLIAAISALLVISGCSHTSMVDFEVTSSPPDAEIDVNGKRIGMTPVNASLPCYREFVGLANAPGGFVSRDKNFLVKAFPPRGKTGEPQTRGVSPCGLRSKSNKTVHFDFSEYDSLEVTILSDETQRIGAETAASPNTTDLVATKTKDISLVLGLNFASVDFDDEIFSGSGNIFGFTLGASINDHYEIGYEYNSSSPFDSFFDDMFHSEPSLDKGRDLGDFEDAYLESQLLFLRRNWSFSQIFSGFALVGYTKIEFEIEKATFDCGPLFPIIPVCFNEDGVGSTTKYRNKESGTAWGAGLEWKRTPNSYLSLKYVDQSVDDFDFSGLYFGFGLRD